MRRALGCRVKSVHPAAYALAEEGAQCRIGVVMAKGPRSGWRAALLNAAEAWYYKVLTEWLCKMVAARRWTVTEFAVRAGISRSAASLILRGKRHPSSGVVMRLCLATGWKPDRLMRVVRKKWENGSTDFPKRSVTIVTSILPGAVVNCHHATRKRKRRW